MDLYGRLLEERKANVKGGLDRDCWVSNYLRARADAGIEHAPGGGLTPDGWMRDKFIAYTAGSLLEAGSDTTASSILVLLLYLVCYPDVLRKAREEIDSVVGSERMPGWEDEERLPYLVACIKESWRIRSITNGTSPLICMPFNFHIQAGCSCIAYGRHPQVPPTSPSRTTSTRATSSRRAR